MAGKTKLRIIGVGNPLMGDDGLGIAAIEQLQQQSLPERVELVDAGCGGLTLLQLLSESEQVLLIDAADFGAPPGRIMRLTADELTTLQNRPLQLSLHQAGLHEVLQLGQQLQQLPELTLLLVQPQSVERRLGLSPAVQQALPELLRLVLQEIG